MGFFSYFLYPWGLILQGLAVIHFIRRRPDNFWIFVILFLGPPGAILYLLLEALPDLGLLRESARVFPRRSRIRELEAAIRDNPSAGNYEELADLYMDDGRFADARECYNRALSSRPDSLDPYCRRAVCAVQMGDYKIAIPDLERVVAADADYDFYRAAGLLAHCYAQIGLHAKAEALFQQVTKISTLSETYYNYAMLLSAEGRNAEARQWAQRILEKKPNMPGYLRRRERPWFRKAEGLLKRLPQ